METVFSLILGGVILLGGFLRYKTFKTEMYYKGFIIGLAVFGSYSIGFSLLYPDKVNSISYYSKESAVVIGALVICAGVYIVTHLKKENVYFNFGKTVMVFIVSMIGLYIGYSINIGSHNLGAVIFFILIMLGAASVQGLMGPLIATINIAAILMIFVKSGIIRFDVTNIFDIYEMAGIEIIYLKWICLLASTGLGAIQAKDYAAEFLEKCHG